MLEHKVTVDLSKNSKQFDYFVEVVKSCNGITNYRKFAYGGAIRGGKTYVTIAIILYLCKRYPGSKWVIIREDFPTLQKTTIESLKKILGQSKDWRPNLDKGNYFFEKSNGSRIYFMGEGITKDPELTKLLGLECNGIFLEQLEEINRKTWDIAASRVGSWYIDPMPPAFLFTTFNPTQKWPKEFIYERHKAGTLPDDFFYLTALPSDNAFVTQDQWNTWLQMDERYQKQFVEGDWTDFDDKDPRWAYAFDIKKHVKDTLPFLPSYPVYLNWDFNRDPLTCTAVQMSPNRGHKDSFIHFIKEFAEPVQLHELCMQIRTTFPASILFCTGDASGRKGDIGYEERNMTHYKLVQRYLKLSDKQMNINTRNLEHNDSRMLVNTMLTTYPNIYYSKEGCPKLISEYRNAKVDVDSSKPGALKKDREENKLDLFDGSRYFYQTYFKDYVDKIFLSK